MESEIKTGTLADFCTANGIECHAIRLDARPDRDATDWDKYASHWSVTLWGNCRYESYSIHTIYSMGSSLKGAPKASEVLWSLLMDASDIKAGCSFEEWAADLGYDTDSRKAKRIFKACKRVHRDLTALLGDLYNTADDLAANE